MNERYLEQSEEQIAQLTEWRIKEARARAGSTPPPGYDGTCQGCGDSVQPARVALGFWNCVECQELVEKERRLKGRT